MTQIIEEKAIEVTFRGETRKYLSHNHDLHCVGSGDCSRCSFRPADKMGYKQLISLEEDGPCPGRYVPNKDDEDEEARAPKDSTNHLIFITNAHIEALQRENEELKDKLEILREELDATEA